MGHLQVNREAEERRKVLRMSRGLNAFVEGKASFDTGDRHDEEIPLSPTNGAVDETESTYTNIEGAHKATFSRAASLLSDSLNLRRRGGVCFLDTVTGPQSMAIQRTGTRMLETESESDARDSPKKGGQRKREDTGSHIHGHTVEGTKDTKLAEVISYSGSSPTAPDLHERPPPGTFSPLGERFLQSLLKHYPRGNVWIFDAVDGLTSEEDDLRTMSTAASEEQRGRRISGKKFEKEILKKHFPNGESSSPSITRNGSRHNSL